jgi:predicted lysophospholipase L1 biosynthesis ABC-type transport system permease subunit
MLAARFPGVVTATIGRDALVSPDDLVVFVGRAADELEREPPVLLVRRIETEPATVTLTRAMRLAFAVGIVGLLTPVIVFVATATRLAATRRERRLAAMRLAGATPDQIGVIAAVEATIAAAAGTAAGFALFFAIRPSLAKVPLDGATFYPDDLQLPLVSAIAIAMGVPLLAAGTAVASLRRARISPLGAARRSTPRRPSPRPLLLIPAGVAVLLGTQATMTDASDTIVAAAVASGLLAMIVGIAGSGPWLTLAIGHVLARAGRHTSSLLAGRRLQDNPAAAFRAIGGLVLAVFIGTVFSSFAASALASTGNSTDRQLPPGVISNTLRPTPPRSMSSPLDAGEPRASFQADPAGTAAGVDWPPLDPRRVEQAVADLHAIDGVDSASTIHALSDEAAIGRIIRSDTGLRGHPAAMTCNDATALGLTTCEGITAVTVSESELRATGVDLTHTLTSTDLAAAAVVAVAAHTDDSTAAVEAARTVLEQLMPANAARTQDDHDARNGATARTIERVSNLALAVTLIIAGCSLAVAIAGSISERRQPFALLRLAGTRLGDLRRIVLTEAAAPLLAATTTTAALGLVVTWLTLASDPDGPSLALPSAGYWLALVGGVAIALGVVAATLPLLRRLTDPDTVRFD